MSLPLVLIPGVAADARLWFHQIVALSLARPVTVAPLPGLPSVEEMSAHLLPHLPDRCALAGAGLGGSVALDMLRRAPDRVAQLVLISTDPLAEAPAVAAAREARLIAARTGRLAEALAQEFPAAALAPGPGRADVQALVAEMGRVRGAEVYQAQARALQRRPDHQKTLRRALAPALVIAGGLDTLVPPRRQQFTVDMMPRAQFLQIDSAGHLPTIETPEEVSDAIETFLGA